MSSEQEEQPKDQFRLSHDELKVPTNYKDKHICPI